MATTTRPEQQTVEYLHVGENAVVNLTRTVAENWAHAVRTLAGVGSDGASLPTPTQVIDRTYVAAHQILENQRLFARGLVSAMEPAVRATESVADSVSQKARSGTDDGESHGE